MKDKKIKLMFVCPHFFPYLGGVVNYIYHLARGLIKDFNYEVIIITTNLENKEYKEETLEGMKIYRLPPQFKVSNTPISFKWKRQIKNIIQKENPDVINAHTPVPFISDVACRIAHKKKIPFLLTYHNDLVKEGFLLNTICKQYYSFMGNKTLNQADKIIATSKYYAETSKYLRKRINKVGIVSPGVNIPKTQIFKKNKNQILFVAQLDKTHNHKGLNYLIEAISFIKNKDVKLNIVGSGDNLEEYKNQIKKLKLENKIKFLGRISDKELSKQYSASEIIVLPSYNSSEGFGMVLIEGMAHKCVAIGTNIGGIPYAIGKEGLLVPPKDSKELARAIIKILSNLKLKKELSEKGYNKVKENFTWEISTKKMDGIIQRVLK